MELNLPRFRTIAPSQYITLAIPNIVNGIDLLEPLLRITVLDSPEANAADSSPRIATMIVPLNQEREWLFCTEPGHYQLLFHLNVSRLILVSNNLDPNTEPRIYIRPPVFNWADTDRIVGELNRIAIAFHPQVSFLNGLPQPLLLTFSRDALYRVILERFVGPCVGEFVVEDLVFESKQCRRGLRFKSMPYLVQSQVPLIPIDCDGLSNLRFDLESLRKLEEVEFMLDTRALVEPHLNCMVCGIFLIDTQLYERMKQGHIPRALCLGVGGGCLLSFLNSQLGFEIVGVEIDEVVVSAARKYFGLNDALPSIKLIVGDAIELLEIVGLVNIDGLDTKFDVVMVDLISNVARSRTSAPPPGFGRRDVFDAMRWLLHDYGALVIHVIPPDVTFYGSLIQKLKEVFVKVYELNAKNGKSFVVIATFKPLPSNVDANAFSERLRSVILGTYMDSLREL